MLSAILSSLRTSYHEGDPSSEEVVYTLFAPSYRGYWTSTGSPNQRGIEKDGRAIFKYLDDNGYLGTRPTSQPDVSLQRDIEDQGRDHDERTQVVLWGASIGANIIMTTLANHLCSITPPLQSGDSEYPNVTSPYTPAAIILETPFLSIPHMLVELYPQKWLPYRYLTPFLRNSWDLEDAVQRISRHPNMGKLGKVLILTAEKDEVVGNAQGDGVEVVLRKFLERGGGKGKESEDKTVVKRVVVRGALHVECLVKGQGKREVMGLLQAVGEAKLKT